MGVFKKVAANAQTGPPHDERRHAGAAQLQDRQGVHQPRHLLRGPVVENVSHVGTFTIKVDISSNHVPRCKHRPPLLQACQRTPRGQKMGPFSIKVP